MKSLLAYAITAVLTGTSVLASAAGEVKLLKVESVVDGHYGLNAQNPRFDVSVANLAYQKHVSVRLKKHDGTWIDVPLRYSRPADAGREIWTGTYYNMTSTGAVAPAWDPEFAIRYVVGQKTYWDNNGGHNYRIGRNDGTILYGKNVYDGNYQPTHFRTTLYQGWVTVKNIAYAKKVQLVYSIDNWKTVRTADAGYSPSFWLFSPDGRRSDAPNPGPNGFEEWGYSLDVGNADQLVYAIKYTVAGKTYWDNNFGRDYRVAFQ